MDIQGFRTMLEGRKVPAEKLDAALALAERFETNPCCWEIYAAGLPFIFRRACYER